MNDPVIYVNDDRTAVLTVWPNGAHVLALRDEHRRWLPEMILTVESQQVPDEVPC